MSVSAEVTGIMLRTDSDDIVVEAEINGEWREVIREYAADNASISHIVEPLGMLKAPPSRLNPDGGLR